VIKLRPISEEQTFSIVPSSYDATTLNSATITLVENGTNVTDNSVTFTQTESANGNYIVVAMTPSVTFKEGQIYTLEMSTASDILYRDLIYITAKTNKKEVFTLPDNYDEYSTGTTEYIIL
jgi:hypothetical protein